MRCRASFHADQAGRQFREEGKHLLAVQFLNQNRIARFVDSVSLKDAFRQIKADCFDMHFERSLLLHSLSAPYLALRSQRRPHHHPDLGGWIMSAPLPPALRTRFQRYIEDGLSGRAAALRLKLSPATGARWARQVRTKGHAEPAPQGPPRGKGKLAPHQAFLEELIAQDPDITLFELRDALAEAEALAGAPFLHRQSAVPARVHVQKKSLVATERLPLIAPLVRATMATRQGKTAARGLVQASAPCHWGLARTRCLY